MPKIYISFCPESGLISEDGYKKRNKGKSILEFPERYIVVDIETTGLDPGYNEIIEICAIKIMNGKIAEKFVSLVKPNEEIDEFVTNLTGISNEMLADAPQPKKVLPFFKKFIGNEILIAHNAHFDINFLYDYTESYLAETLNNDFICTMRLARRIFPDFNNHKLITICRNLNIEIPTHRATSDAMAAWKVYENCKTQISQTVGVERFLQDIKKSRTLRASDIKPNTITFDTQHPVYGKTFVFTGTLTKMTRKDAMQLVVDLGGSCSNGVTKNTNYLVMGVQDYSRFADGEKSNKTKKAEKLMLQDYDILILSENNFYDLVLDEDF